MIRRIASLIALSILAPVPVKAQQSGILLGLHVNTDSGEKYRTYWIAPENGKVRVLLAGPDLIVPGKTGFSRVCVIDVTEDEDREHHELQNLVIEPATSSRAHCESQPRKSAEESHQGYYCTTTDEIRILFVGPNAISTEHSWEGDCGAHPSSAMDINLTSLEGDTIRYLGLTDSVHRRELRTATTRAAREAYADMGTVDSTSDNPDDPPSTSRFSTDEQWGIERGQGYWHAKGEASCSPIIGCMQVSTFAIPEYRAPRKLVGHNELFPTLDRIKKDVPSAKDAFSSPLRDLVVIVNDSDGLVAFAPRGGKLGAPVARIPLDGDIVMAEWATGRFVARWTAKLRELLPLDMAARWVR